LGISTIVPIENHRRFLFLLSFFLGVSFIPTHTNRLHTVLLCAHVRVCVLVNFFLH
jgi:hypothetical protein